MESKKINQLATAVNPSTSDLAIIGDPVTGVSKKITWLQVSTLIGTAANLQQVTDNGATTTNPVTIGGLTITGLSTGVLKSDSGVISSVPFGAANGVATLAGDGKVPSSQLPSYVDDVVEVANYAALPVTGETGKIYITLDNNKVYRWGGSVYVEIAANNAIWGSITGTLANQIDLQNVLDLKATDSLVVHLAGTETITGTKTFSNPTKNNGGISLQNGSSHSLSGYMNLGGMTDGLRFTSGGGISNFFTLPSSVGYTYTFPALSGTIVAISGGNSTQYIDGTGALQTFPTLISSDKLVKLVRNQSGATMTAGTIVYISGATGNKPLITKALATGDSTSAQTYGLVQADIANNADGYVVVIGNITDIDTSALTEGQQLYLSGTTAGAYTTTKPYAPIHLVYIGIVLRSHPTQGIIGVKIQNGYEMDELHNVDAQSPSNNDILSYNTSTSLWEHKQIATTLGFTPISLASLSATSPLSYNNTTGAFSIQVATASQNGYLSSTDWSTFNNKQAALGGTGFVKISGSTISYDNSTYYLASNPSAFITLTSLSAGDGISYSNTTGVISSTITQYTDALARAAISSSATGLTYTSSTGVFSLTAGYAIPTTAKQTEWDTAYTNRITSLTTTGTSGAATLVANTLNIPNYGSALSGYVTLATAQTISANKTFSEFGFFDKGVLIKQGNYPASSGYNGIGAIGGGFYFGMGQTSVHLLSFSTSNSYNYTYPNATGTLALTSDIPSLANYVTLDGTQTITGAKTFTSDFKSPMVSIANSNTLYTRTGYTTLSASSISTTAWVAFSWGNTNAATLSFNNAAQYTYTFPAANGTLALTSNLSSYVPYTGATTDVSLGNNTLLSKFVFIEGDGTQGGILSFKQYATSWTSTTNHTNIYATDTDKLNFNFYQVGGGKSFTFNVSGLTAGTNRTYTMPDAAGTLALTSQIPTLSGLGGVPTSRTLTINGTTYDLSANRSWTITAGLADGFTTYGTLYARTAMTTYRDHSVSAPDDAPIKSRIGTEDNWIYLDSANAQWGIYHRNIDTDLVVSGQPTLPNNSIAFIGANIIASYVSLATGNGYYRGTLSAANLSGTNTGDQDLSGYLTTATASATYLPLSGGALTGRLSINLTNNYGVLMNRPATTNYIGLMYQTAASNQWFVGMRENSTNNYIVYNEVLGTDALTISRTNDNATFSSNVSIRGGSNFGGYYMNYQTDATSRSFRISSEHLVFGDFVIQRSTTRTGTTYENLLYFDANKSASFPNSITSGLFSRFYNTCVGGAPSGNTYAAYADAVVGIGNLHLVTTGSSDAVYVNTALAKPFIVNPVGGNVMIGTTTDNGTHKLQVTGKIRTTDNILVTAVGEAWGEGVAVSVPSTAYWGGFRLRRERSGYDGNWYFGYVGFDSTDDFVFGVNNSGAQIDNVIRLTKAGNVLMGKAVANSFGSAMSLQINGVGGSLLETSYNGTSGLRIGSGSDHSYHHDPRNAEMRFATSDSTRFYIYGNGNYSFTGSNVSDRRAKDNISLLDITATDKIMSLEAKSYNMKNNPSQKRYGFIAQEVKQIVSDLVSGNENDGYLGLDYDGLLTLAIKALQEQQKEIQILKQK